MPSNYVNLDALIPREDFLVDSGPAYGESEKKSVTTTDLKEGESFYSSLRSQISKEKQMLGLQSM